MRLLNFIHRNIITLLILITVTVITTTGDRLFAFGVDIRLYRNLLLPWQAIINASIKDNAKWLEMPVANNTEYAKEVYLSLLEQGYAPPYPEYRVILPWNIHIYQVIIIPQPNQVIINGLDVDSALRLDRWIDGVADLNQGAFQAFFDDDRRLVLFWRI